MACETFRRVENILCTCRFAEHLLRELLLSHSCFRGSLRRLQGHSLLGGNSPGWPHARAPEDRVECRRGCSLRTFRPRLVAFRHGDYRVLTCDGAVGVAVVLEGYTRNIFRTSAAKAHMAWIPEEIVSRVFTVLGTTLPIVSRLLDSSSALCQSRTKACVHHHGHFDSVGGNHSSAACGVRLR